jgi:hypothetical protein
MLRLSALVMAAAALGACSVRSLDGIGAAAGGPAIDQAVTECEARYQAHALTGWEQVAQCEREVATPRQLQEGPNLALLYDETWDNKTRLYRAIDRERLTKAEADARQAIDTRNMITIIQSIRGSDR